MLAFQMRPELVISADRNQVWIPYSVHFPIVKRGKSSTSAPCHHIEGRFVDLQPLDTLRARIAAASFYNDPSEEIKSSARTCCLCGIKRLSNNSTNSNSHYKHVWGTCGLTPDLIELLRILTKGEIDWPMHMPIALLKTYLSIQGEN